jgi:hypothetical protein
MSTPVATPTDLGLYLDVVIDANDPRALLVLSMAQDLCETIVSPLPATARAVVLDVASRAYSNPRQLHDARIGSASLQFGSTANNSAIGGLYLSRANKAALKALAGRGAAFSADTMPQGANAVQTVMVTATAGTYTLTFAGATSTPIAWNATAATVQAALDAMPPIGAGNAQVAGAYSVTFVGSLATCPVPPLTANGASLTGSVAVTQTTVGVMAPGQNLPPWDIDRYSSGYRDPSIYGGY